MARLDFNILETVARRKNYGEFWKSYLGMLDDNDNFDDHSRKSRAVYDGFQTDESTFKKGKGSSTSGPIGGVGTYVQRMVTTQLKEGAGGPPESDSLEKMIGLVSKIGRPREMLKEFGKMLGDEVLLYLKQQADLLHKINAETGMIGTLSEDFRKEIMNASPEVIRLGISFDEMTESVSNLVSQSGKFKLLSKDTIEEMALASKFTKDMTTFVDMAGNFERAGIGAKDMALMVEKMGLKSMGLGLNARTTTTLINENLKNLNQYGFKNGVDGLNKMVQQSIEFRMNMKNVFDFAEKIWSPEGALDVVANLQMIGGAYGDLNDPIKLMYMATNDVEGLQEAIKGAAKSLVTYNAEQGRFQVTGANLRRAKEMADQLGMSMEELTTTAVAGMERMQASTDLMSSGLQLSDENREFLTNLAQMKGGKMTIEVPESIQKELGLESTNIALESLNQDLANQLIARQEELRDKTMEEVAREQVTALENINRDTSFLRAAVRVGVGNEVGNIIERVLGINQTLISKESKEITNEIAKLFGKGGTAIKSLIDKAPSLNLAGGYKGNITAETKLQELEKISENLSKTQVKTKETPIETTSRRDVLDVNINSSSALVDDAARAIWRDPQFMADFRRDFEKGYLSQTKN